MGNSTELTALVERIAACQGGDTYFTAAEVVAWPADLTQGIESLGLLTKASPAQSAECSGCEMACVMPVEVIPGVTEALTRALIFCDKRNDISRVEVPLHSLERRKSSGPMLAEALAKLLLMAPARPAQIDATRWRVGPFQGLKHKSPLVLALDREPILAIAGQTVKLVEVLAFKKGKVAIDLPALRKLVDHPSGGQSDAEKWGPERADRIRKRMVELKAEGVTAPRKQVAAEEGVDDSRIGQILRKYPEQKPRSQWHPGAAPAPARPPARKPRT
ncbi:hypothetical protein [Hydrogenophaga sp.]|uniref:hypothetical protein n=1 Tax=Hydrogenophaga sp. TaxID=1904254 RepID=UPI003D0F554F